MRKTTSHKSGTKEHSSLVMKRIQSKYAMIDKAVEECIKACQICANICEKCACENKGKAGMKLSVRLCLDCKDACNELIAVSTTDAKLDAYYQECEAACEACASRCEYHAEMSHCKECAEACRTCAAKCKTIMDLAA